MMRVRLVRIAEVVLLHPGPARVMLVSLMLASSLGTTLAGFVGLSDLAVAASVSVL